MNVKKQPYTLGVDVGIASVGAALLGAGSIVGMHVRTFDAAEIAKTGDPLNQIRREARSTRRRIRRRAHRLLRLRRLFKREGLVESIEPSAFATSVSAWQLRSEGLERILSPQEWAAVLYHLVKHRGFQSNRKSEAKANAKIGEMLASVRENQQLMRDNDYLTVGQMVWKDPAFQGAKRNKGGSYKHTFARDDLIHELECLFTAQRRLGSTHAELPFTDKVMELLLARRPVFTGDDILKMVGRCTFEPTELRAAKAAYSSERFIWLGRLNNLKLLYPGEQRLLSDQERGLLLELPFEQASVKFSQVRKKLGLPNHVRFNLVRYALDETQEKAESRTFFEAKAHHSIRKAYEEAGLTLEWERDKRNATRLDEIATAIALFREDERIRSELLSAEIPENIIETVLGCQFEQFINLSLLVLRKVLPYLEQGQRYDIALKSAGYQHSTPRVVACKTGRIPKPDRDQIRNPVVYRSVNQARKLINAIIAECGPPSAIHLELSRDMSRPLQERRSIEREQDKYRKEKERITAEFMEHFDRQPNGLDLLKFRLYKEQDAKCAYTLTALDLNRLAEPGYVEVDHILPYSRSYDDSLLNKTLVLVAANRNKGNRTPFEFMGGDENSEVWRKYLAWVQSNPKIRQAKRNRYLRKDFGAETAREFRERHLNDTRYIGRELKAMIEQHVIWNTASDVPGAERCVILSGRLTSLLRHRWGFDKVRSNGDLHHAVDAAVIAATSRGMIQRMARHARYHELKTVKESYADPETGEILNLTAARSLDRQFPLPWESFRQNVIEYLSPAPITANPVGQKMHEGVRVSRAPTRRNTGAAHQETIRSVGKDKALLKQGMSAVKTPLHKLKLKDIESIAGYDDPRNQALIDAIRTRLEAFGGDGSKAFSENQPPLYRPSGPGKQAPIVRTVNLLSSQKSGLEVRQGIAGNDSMVRVDVFTKAGRFYVVPLYVADIARTVLPNRAVVAYKPEEEWPEMDASYQFLFSLHSNDWLRVTLKTQVFSGYFAGLDRSTGAVSIWAHDRDQRVGKNGLYRGIGVKTALAVEKHHVDILGRLFKSKDEVRQPLRKGQEL